MSYTRKGWGLNDADNKLCTCCDTLRPRTDFHKNKARHDGLEVYCKPCVKRRRQERLKNKEEKKKHNAYAKTWRDKNPDKVKDSASRYRENNRDKLEAKRKSPAGRQYRREYMKMRREDPAFRLRSNVSRQVHQALSRENSSKHGESVFKNLPYSPTQLREHLETQFDAHMTWENYGSYWHVDHIYPQSKLPYTSMEDENFLKCWDLSNLQPLEAIENIKKSNKILDN